MQKKLIALAVAGLGLTASAFAQTNVTIYGILDETFGASEALGSVASANEKLRTVKLDSNSSYIGFKGTEDLGDGLSAIFQIESGFAADTAGALAGGRDTFVGLKGGWGTVKLGTVTGPTRALAANVEYAAGFSSSATTSSLTGAIAGVATGADLRMTNAVYYVSPDFNGFTVQAAFGAGEVHTATTNSKNWTIGANYNNGPLYVAVAYLDRKDPLAAALGGVGVTDDELKESKLGAKYSFDQGTTVSALYDHVKYEANTIGGSGDITRNAWMVGVNQAFGAGARNNVWLQYARANELSGSGCGGGCSDTDAKQWVLGYSYNLSKRTMIHAFYTAIDNKTNTAGTVYDFANNPTGLVNGLVGSTGADPKAYGVGIRHAF